MTLNAKIVVFIDFLTIFGCETHFKKNCTEINKDRRGQGPCEIFSLNVDLDGLSLDFLGSRKLMHEGIKERYLRKSRYFTVVGQSFVKTFADGQGHAAYQNKH